MRPDGAILRISQDRLLEKRFLNDAGVATAPWGPVHDVTELVDEAQRHGLPAVLKTTRLGYDGKGQVLARNEEEAADAPSDDDDDLGGNPAYGSIISWSSADHVGPIGVLYVILALILVSGRVIGDRASSLPT